MPFSPFFTLRPSWFHAYMPATRVASGLLPCDFEDVPEAVAVKPAHGGEVGGKGVGMAGLQLFNQEFHVGLNGFFGGLGLGGEMGMVWTLLAVVVMLFCSLWLWLLPFCVAAL